MTDLWITHPAEPGLGTETSRWYTTVMVPCQSQVCKIVVSGNTGLPDAVTVHGVQAAGNWRHHAKAVTALFGDPNAPYCWKVARRIEHNLHHVLPPSTIADDYLAAAVSAATAALCWEPDLTHARLVAALIARNEETPSTNALWAIHPALDRVAENHTERFMNPGGHPTIQPWPNPETRQRWESVWGDQPIGFWAANWWSRQHRYDPSQALAKWRQLSHPGTHDVANGHHPRDPGSLRKEL